MSAYLGRAKAKEASHQPGDALQDYREALALDPQNQEAQQNIAHLSSQLSNLLGVQAQELSAMRASASQVKRPKKRPSVVLTGITSSLPVVFVENPSRLSEAEMVLEGGRFIIRES